jgi:tetratricopeptide (TPR) repeat protein
VTSDQRRYKEALRRGRAYNDDEDWSRAVDMFRIALQEAPQSPAAYAGLGEACFGLKRLGPALDSYKLAARYSRGDLQYLERVADLQERLGLLSEAARTYMAAGELQLRRRQLEQAIYNWERAVRLEPDLLGAHRRLAMVHQRQRNVRGAIREYLAIARIFQYQGLRRQALQMCHAALRLDPDNEDAQLALRLVREGVAALGEEAPFVPEPEEEEILAGVEDEGAPAAEKEIAVQRARKEVPAAQAPVAQTRGPQQPAVVADGEHEEMAETVRQIATAFEEERQAWQQSQEPEGPVDALDLAKRRAQDELAEEIFREEEGDEDLYGSGPDGLSKLERDALIGQGIDFQSRGDSKNAITCYEKAVAGGLRLPAAYFTLGILYLENGRRRHAHAAFVRAGRDTSYRPPIKLALARAKQ